MESIAQTATAPSDSKSPADEMVDRILTASLDRLIDALPDAVNEAMQKAIPHLYTPDLAAEFAEGMAVSLRAQHAKRTGVSA